MAASWSCAGPRRKFFQLVSQPHPLLRMALLEFLLTAVLLFTVVSTVRWTTAPDSPLSVPLAGQRSRVFMGLFFGAVNAAVIGPSMRRRTAGHMNPAVSIGLWLLHEFPGRSVLPFVCAQLSGSLAGVALAGFLWGDEAADSPVHYATIAPAANWNAGAVFAAETGAMAGIMLLVAVLVSRADLKRYLPAAVGCCIAAVNIFLGGLSGGSINPARQFGPAAFSGQIDFLWIYLLAPIAGSCLAGAISAFMKTSDHQAVQDPYPAMSDAPK